jgi:hypothetical protein
MTQNLDDLNAELDAMIEDLPASLEWAGQVISAAKSEKGAGVEVETYSFNADITLVISFPIRRLNSSALPVAQDRVRVDGEKYEIVTANKSRDGLVLRLALKDDRRRVP